MYMRSGTGKRSTGSLQDSLHDFSLGLGTRLELTLTGGRVAYDIQTHLSGWSTDGQTRRQISRKFNNASDLLSPRFLLKVLKPPHYLKIHCHSTSLTWVGEVISGANLELFRMCGLSRPGCTIAAGNQRPNGRSCTKHIPDRRILAQYFLHRIFFRITAFGWIHNYMRSYAELLRPAVE
jgi:hypothetical protein